MEFLVLCVFDEKMEMYVFLNSIYKHLVILVVRFTGRYMAWMLMCYRLWILTLDNN